MAMTNDHRTKILTVVDGQNELLPLMHIIYNRNGAILILEYLIKNNIIGKKLVEFVNAHDNYLEAIRSIQKKLKIKHGSASEHFRF